MQVSFIARGEGENLNRFQLLGWGRTGSSKQGILEEHDFRPYSPYGEKELMMKKIELNYKCLLLENTWHSYQIFSLEKVINFFSQKCFELSLLRIACHPREVLLHWTMVLL